MMSQGYIIMKVDYQVYRGSVMTLFGLQELSIYIMVMKNTLMARIGDMEGTDILWTGLS